jgi:hypothetical protein
MYFMGTQVAEWRAEGAKRLWPRVGDWAWLCMLLLLTMATFHPRSPVNSHVRSAFAPALMMVPLVLQTRRRSPRRVRRIAGELECPEWFLVDLKLERRGVEIGRDSGVLWFEGGLLRFRGLRTQFALPAPYGLTDVPSEGKHREFAHVIQIDGPEGGCRIQIRICRRHAVARRQGTWSFDSVLQTWFSSGDHVEDEVVYPPVRLDPELVWPEPAMRSFYVVAVTVSLATCGGTAFVFDHGITSTGVLWGIAGAAFVALVFLPLQIIVGYERRKLRHLFPDDPAFKS